MIEKAKLESWYFKERKSQQEIADVLGCSLHKVSYWVGKHGIKTRSISDAIYLRHNPHGDPFKFSPPRTIADFQLFGLGMGLYWGEGTKANKDSVRLGNTDPALIKQFINFLVRFFGIERKDLRFGIQIFTDIGMGVAMDFWIKKLRIHRSQFYKPIVTKSGSLGTYRKRSEYGVVTVMYHNKRLRNLLVDMLADVAQR